MKTIYINTDGGARGNPGPAGIGVVFRDLMGEIVTCYKEYIGEATNNVAEYKALILALEQARNFEAEELHINMDSELIVKQMKGEYKIKDPNLKLLADQVRKLKRYFKYIEFSHVPREKNKEADKLVNQAIDAAVAVKDSH